MFERISNSQIIGPRPRGLGGRVKRISDQEFRDVWQWTLLPSFFVRNKLGTKIMPTTRLRECWAKKRIGYNDGEII